MRTLHASALLLTLVSSALAQGMTFSRIAPKGSEFFEGNSASDIMLGNWAPQTRTQQVDNNLVGTNVPLIRFLGWRRNGSSNSGAAKVTDLTILMGHADYNAITNTFATNYKSAAQTVFTKKPVSLPDWNGASGSVPSPCDLVVPLDLPFVYNNTDALVWEVLNENNPMGIYTQDWVSSMTHTYGDYSTNLGGGCATGNGQMKHRVALRANATVLEMGYDVAAAPSNAPLTLLLGISDPAANLPGLCGTIHCLPLTTLGMGNSGAAGELALSFPISTPWNPSFAGAVLYTQVVAPDATQTGLPLALSNGLRSSAPAGNAVGTTPINVKRIYHTTSVTTPTGTGPSISGVVTLYGF